MSLWPTVLLAAVGAALLTVFEPVTWALMAELASESRATANGVLATSNQLGATIRASVGGLVLAFAGPGGRDHGSLGYWRKAAGHRRNPCPGGRRMNLSKGSGWRSSFRLQSTVDRFARGG